MPTITVMLVSTNNKSILLISVLKLKELLQLKHKNKVESFRKSQLSMLVTHDTM